jgi:hypothetical protein
MVTSDQTKRVDIPAGFGAIALVRWGGRRHRIGGAACSEVPASILRWVSIGRDSNCVWGHSLVDYLDRSFPCPIDCGWRDARATILPVASKLVGGARRHVQVCNVQHWIHGTGRRVGTSLGLCCTDVWVDCTRWSARWPGRNRVIRGGGPAYGLYRDLADTQRHRVFVIVEELNGPKSVAGATVGNGGSF